MAKPDQIFYLIFRVFLLDCKEALQQTYEEFGSENVILLIDSIQKPAILKNVNNHHRSVSLFAQGLIYFHDVSASKAIYDKPTELLLDIFGDLQKAHSNIVLHFNWKTISWISRYVQ